LIGQQNLGFRFGDQMLIFGESLQMEALVVVSLVAGSLP